VAHSSFEHRADIWVENPVRYKRPGPFSAAGSTLRAGVAISLIMLICAAALGAGAKFFTGKQPKYASLARASLDTPPLRDRCHHDDAPFNGLPDRKRCTMGDPAHITAVLWGDSHADHLAPLMGAFVEKHGSGGILQRSFSSCRSLEADARKVTEQTDACLQFNMAVEEEISELRKQGMKGVVLSSMWITVFPADLAQPGVSSARRRADAIAAVDHVVSKLESEGLRIVIVAPTYIMPRSVPQCLARHSDEQCSAVRKSIEARRHPALAALEEIAAAHPGTVRLWDPVESLCDAQLCPARRGKTVMFTDDLHLSASAARELLSSADPTLSWLVQD